MFKTVGTKDRLVDRVVAEIQNRIIHGDLKPDMMLPPERELCEQLQVSRTVVREAVRMLVTKGLLETRPGVGTSVKRLTSERVSEPLSMLLIQDDRIDLDHIHEVRQILEVGIVRLAARHATAADLERLDEILSSMKAAKTDRSAFASLDGEFHQQLAQITHNPLLSILLDTVRDAMGSVRQMTSEYPGLYETVIPDHTHIIAALKAHDPEQAVTAMLQHLDNAQRIQREVLAAAQATA